MSKIKPFTNKYKGNEINYRSGIDYWKKMRKNKPAIAPNVLYVICLETQIVKNKSFF